MLLLEPKADTGRQTSRQKGFTLLELLVVLVIVAIISSTSIGALRFFGEQTIKTFQNQVTSLLSLAIEEAILTGKVHGLFRNDTQLLLRKFSRPEAKEKKTQGNTTKEAVGSVLSGLVALSKKGDTESESARAPQVAISSDPGAFPEDAGGSWIDLELQPLNIPAGLELSIDTDQPISLEDFNSETDEETEKIQFSLQTREKEADTKGDEDKKKEKPQQEKLITTFWPSGLVQPGGTATILSEEEGKEVSIRWLTTAEIEVTSNN